MTDKQDIEHKIPKETPRREKAALGIGGVTRKIEFLKQCLQLNLLVSSCSSWCKLSGSVFFFEKGPNGQNWWTFQVFERFYTYSITINIFEIESRVISII